MSFLAKTKTVITIAGKEFSIVSDESSEYVNRVAFVLNKKLKELNAESISLSTHMLMTLAALNVTDDFLKVTDALAETKKQLETLTKEMRTVEIEKSISDATSQKLTNQSKDTESELSSIRNQVVQLQKENESLRNQVANKVKNFRSN